MDDERKRPANSAEILDELRTAEYEKPYGRTIYSSAEELLDSLSDD